MNSKLKWNVVFAGQFTTWLFHRSRRACGWNSRTGRLAEFATTALTARIQKRKRFEHYAQLADFLMRVLIFPGVQLQAAFHQERTTFLEILADDFGLSAKRINIHKSYFFLRFPRFVLPSAVQRHADLGNRSALRGIPQLRISCEVARQDDFVEVGHKT